MNGRVYRICTCLQQLGAPVLLGDTAHSQLAGAASYGHLAALDFRRQQTD